jgi:hypothetical protein
LKRNRGKMVMLAFALAAGVVAPLRFQLPIGLFFSGLFWSVSVALAADLTDRPWFLAGSVLLVVVSGVAGPFAFQELWRVIALEAMVGLLALTFGLALYIGISAPPSRGSAE